MPFTYPGANISKTTGSAVYPIQAVADSGNVTRVGPLVTPEDLRNTYLFGIPLTAPLTKQAINDETLKTFINRALGVAEAETGITIVETVRNTRSPYDKSLNNYWWFLELPYRPITQLASWDIVTSDGSIIYQVPAPLVEAQNMIFGQLSIGWSTVPTSASIVADGFFGNAAAVLIRNLGVYNTPAFWTTQYTTGYPLNKIPIIINNLIGVLAAIDILSMISPLKFNTSSGLGIDGLSQNTSSPGPQWLMMRLNDLREKHDMLVDQIKSMYYLKFIVSNF